MHGDSELAIIAAALRLYILFSVFDGQPHTWSEFLLTKGSLRQLEDDLPFVLALEEIPRDHLQELARAYDLLLKIAQAA